MLVARDCGAGASSNFMRGARNALLAFAFISHPSTSFADAPALEAREPGQRIVVLDTAGGEGIDADLEATLGELLGRLHIALVRSDAAGGVVVARVHLESNERGAVLVVESGQRNASPVRREVERGDSPALFRETLAHVILGAIEPLATESEKPAPPPRPPEPAPAPPAPIARDDVRGEPMRLSIGARAGPRLLESDRLGIGFAGVATVTLGTALRPSAGLHAGYVLPARASADGVDAEFRLVPLRVEGRIQPVAWQSIAVETGLVGGVDLVWFEPQTAPSFVHLADTSRRAQPMLGAVVTGRFRLSWSADFVLSTGVDVDLSPPRWVIASPAERDTLFEMARLRPYLALGLDFAMLGAATPGPAVVGLR
jgi:hypothetical protein